MPLFLCTQVKIIKCVIDNLVMDISFNQVGGVSTLCFLELVRECNLNYSFQFEVFILNTYPAACIKNTCKLDP